MVRLPLSYLTYLAFSALPLGRFVSERDPSVSAADSIHNTTRGKDGAMTLGWVGVRYRSPPSLQRRFDRRQASVGCRMPATAQLPR